jgi:hypothetical protein
VSEPTWALHEELVHKALARSGADDPGPALCALLWLLGDRHRAAVAAFAMSACHEGFELPDARTGTVAESVRDLATGTAGGHTRHAGGERHAPPVTYQTASMALGMQVVADVLGELIPLWDFEPMGKAAAAAFAARRGSR